MHAMGKYFHWIWIGASVAISACAFPGFGATVTVFVGNTNLSGLAADVFVPPSTNISVNDQVVWVWEGLNHSTTSGTNGVAGDDNGVPSGLWGSGVNNRPHSFTNIVHFSWQFFVLLSDSLLFWHDRIDQCSGGRTAAKHFNHQSNRRRHFQRASFIHAGGNGFRSGWNGHQRSIFPGSDLAGQCGHQPLHDAGQQSCRCRLHVFRRGHR